MILEYILSLFLISLRMSWFTQGNLSLDRFDGMKIEDSSFSLVFSEFHILVDSSLMTEATIFFLKLNILFLKGVQSALLKSLAFIWGWMFGGDNLISQ